MSVYAQNIDSAWAIQKEGREADGVVLRTAGSLRVTEEGCINKLFSSEAQSGAHTNSIGY